MCVRYTVLWYQLEGGEILLTFDCNASVFALKKTEASLLTSRQEFHHATSSWLVPDYCVFYTLRPAERLLLQYMRVCYMYIASHVLYLHTHRERERAQS